MHQKGDDPYQKLGSWRKPSCSVYLLDCRAACAGTRWSVAEAAARHATPGHSFATTTGGLIDLHHDRIYNTLDFLLPCLEFILLGELVLVEPIKCVLHRTVNLGLGEPALLVRDGDLVGLAG